MRLRTMLSEPLLLKEMASQARRRVRPGLTYPGLWWFLLVTHGPPLLLWKAGSLMGGEDPRQCFTLSVLLQVWLIALRSTLYPSVSMACDVREGTVPVLLSSPLSPARALRAKLVACLLPLWMELLLVQPLFFGFYVWAGGVPVETVLYVDGFLWSVSLVFGCLGLWLGSQLPDPERAAANARLLVGLLLVGSFFLERLLTWPFLVVGAVFLCLAYAPSRPGAPAHQSLLPVLVLVFSLPFLMSLQRGALSNFELSAYNPLRCAFTLGQNEAPDHLIPELLEPAHNDAEASLRVRSQLPPEEVHRRAAWHLVPCSGVYLLLGGLLFWLALTRVRHLA